MAPAFAWLAAAVVTAAAAAPVPLDLASFQGKRVMFITAHPDDVEGFAGGLAASLGTGHSHRGGGPGSGANATEVAYLIVTSGNAGGKCYDNSTWPQPPPGGFFDCEKEELAATRRRESIVAAASLGVHTVYRLGVDDGMSVAVHETRVRRAITAYVRTFRPHIVVTHGPLPDFDAPPTCNGACPLPAGWDDLGFHPDHQHVGALVFHSLYGGGSAADNDLVFGDLAAAGVEGWRVQQLYFFALTAKPMTHYLELTPQLLSAKVNASALHRSQYQDTVPTATFQFVAEQAGKVAGVPLAEGYQGWF